jgi:hypothetical protein
MAIRPTMLVCSARSSKEASSVKRAAAPSA